AAAGITALLFAIPFAYDVLRFSGAAYLLFLAWQAVKPGGTSPFQVKQLGRDSDKKLYLMGLFTSLLNPKVALLYLALLPQFIDPLRGNIFGQSLALGLVQICVSITVNSTYVAAAGSIALFLKNRPNWILVQRWVMGFVLAAMAIQISLQVRK
ncbi:MAG: LysE family translocator, partial [Bdellovibrionota bacterium]